MTSGTYFHRSYVGSRPDVQALIPPESKTILDLGCSSGALGEALKKQRADVTVVGIEYDPTMAQTAERCLDKVFCSDIETFDWSGLGNTAFDCVVCADVLEHLRDPWSVFANAVDHMAPQGQIIVSVPNIRHISSLFLVYGRGIWPVDDRGLFDKTHLRFFTLHNIRELYDSSGCRIETISRNYRVVGSSYHWLNAAFNRLGLTTVMDWVPYLREFFTYQYVVTGRRKKLRQA